MDIHNEFIAQGKRLYFYKGKAVLNKIHRFFDINGDDWNFTDATAFTFNIWEEREGGLQVVEWTSPTNLTLNATATNEIILNAPGTDLNMERGRYYYEMEYIAQGYPILIAYGEATVL